MKSFSLRAAGILSTLVMASLPMGAQAGAVSAIQTNLSLTITDSSGAQWDLGSELAGFINPDLSTGTVSLQEPGSAVSDADGVWTPNTTTIINGQTVTGLGWHSWLTANGTTATTTDSSNPWAASLIVTHLGGLIDPSMDYGFYFKNNSSGTQTYSVTYGQSIEPIITGAYTIEADIAGAMTNVDGSTSVQPNHASGLIQRVMLSSNGGETFVNGGVNVGPGAVATGTSTYGPYSAQNSGVAPTGGYDYWAFQTTFTLSGNKDVFVANGSATITPAPVPEPASVALALTALGAMAWRQRRSSQA